MSEQFSLAERNTISAIVESLELLQGLRANMPLHQAIILMRCALDEGKSQKYYSAKLGYPTATVSRAFLDLGKKSRDGGPGLGLIEDRPAPHNLRENEQYLSVKGTALLRKISRKFLQ